MRSKPFALLLSLLALTPLSWCLADPQSSETVEGSVTRKLDYLLYVPESYDASADKEWPLLVFLHGAGERGDDLELVKKHGPPKKIAAGESMPLIVASPQCPKDDWWEPNTVMILIEGLEKKLKIDPDRIYLTGLSMGGFGTWNTATRYPDKFAAIAPICGGGSDFMAGRRLEEMPVWCFHGGKDTSVPIEQSRRIIDTLRAKGNDQVKFTIYPEAGHDSWTASYDNPKLYDWFLRHTLADRK